MLKRKLVFVRFHIWAAWWQNQQNSMCTQRRLRSAWASAQSRCPGWSESPLSTWRKLGYLAIHWAPRKDWSRLIWVYVGRTPFCWFCYEAAHFYFSSSWCQRRSATVECDTPWTWHGRSFKVAGHLLVPISFHCLLTIWSESGFDVVCPLIRQDEWICLFIFTAYYYLVYYPIFFFNARYTWSCIFLNNRKMYMVFDISTIFFRMKTLQEQCNWMWSKRCFFFFFFFALIVWQQYTPEQTQGHARFLAEQESGRNPVLCRRKGHEKVSWCTIDSWWSTELWTPPPSPRPLLSAGGSLLLTDNNAILQRWTKLL